jgi:RimJ/RimL family protein N-acetyltransferase
MAPREQRPDDLLAVRRATMADALDILAWRNDPLSRKMSRNSNAIDEQQHLGWLERALADSTQILLVAIRGSNKVGLVRLALVSPGTWEVSISLNPAERGKGYGHAILAAGLRSFAQAGRKRIVASIKPCNVASRRIFEAQGFIRVGECGGLGLFELVLPDGTGCGTGDDPQ